jgi:hypothetical protein
MKKQRQPTMTLKKAMDCMHRIGTCMVKMRAAESPDGFAYYLVPGGRVSTEIADKIKARPDVSAGSDGLFPGHDQTWRIIV